MSQNVEFLVYSPLDKYYRMNPGKGLVLLQKLCFWVLDKLGLGEESPRVTRYSIDPDDFVERLLAQYDFIRKEFNRMPTKLMIGPEELKGLIGGKAVDELVKFNLEYMNRGTIHGLQVNVIPWMKGILVVPE